MCLKTPLLLAFFCIVNDASSQIHPKLPLSCGRNRFHNARERISFGETAELGQFPYFVRIGEWDIIDSRFVYAFFCGGTLISRYYVITAAHCHSPGKLFVRVGENDITTDIDCDRFEKCAPSHQDIQVNKFISDDYDKIKMTQDYALIELKVPVEFNDYVQPVCLRPAAMDHATYIGKRVFVAGFGLVSSDPPKDPTQLQYIKIPILDDSICNLIYNKHNFSITENQWCIGHLSRKETSCQGDSGGPVIMSMNEDGERRDYLIGLPSYALSDCASPGVYTDISKYLNWTIEKLELS